jgi:iron complex outermembrane receptor protein
MKIRYLPAFSLKASLALTASVLALAPAAYAQTAPVDNLETVVVTGSRSAPRAVLDTLAPVDVIPATQIAHMGTTDLAQALSQALPSLNFTHPAVTDGTDSLRPATLRGMSPDQTLVLINSKRAHTSALVNLNGSLGYGAAGMDLNTIPAAALGNVEVLRDGAAAQYGSDAIAGVINLRLKEASSGGGVTVSGGFYDTDVNYNLTGAPQPTGAKLPTARHLDDGAIGVVSAWKGFDLGNGFITITAEYKNQAHTTRAGPDPRQQYALIAGALDPREQTINRFVNWYGDPKMQQYTGYLNAGYDLSSDVHLYAFAGYQFRDALSAANWRRPGQQTLANPATNLLAVYPNGFLPKIGSKIEDATATAGIKGVTDGWNWDASLSYGFNGYHFDTIDSVNVSLGPTSPTHFYSGGPRYSQDVFNLDITRPIDLLGMKDVNLAFGGEARLETYRITAGEPASYAFGGYVTPTGNLGSSGAQGFPGFAASDAVTASRNSQSAYVDIEAKPLDGLDVDFAGRFEDYSDFGSTVNGKIAARYDFSDMFAIRGAVSSGFRAPSLQQEYVSYTSTTFIAGNPINSTVLRASNPVAKFIGAVPLKPENSVNYSVGGVFRWDEFSATLDAYSISVGNRIALSDSITAANVIALFPASAQIGGVRFFTNGVDTITEGAELVTAYRWRPEADIGNFNFSFSASHNETNVRALRSTPQLSSLTPPPAFLTHYRIASLTEGQPKWKAALVTDWTYDWLGVTATANYYGSLLQPFNGNNVLGDYHLNSKILFDLEARIDFDYGVQLAVGAQNLLDTYPTTPPYVLNGQNISTNGVGQFPEYSPFGFDGRYLYARIGYHF